MNKIITRKIALIIAQNTSDCHPVYGADECEQAAEAVLKCIIKDIEVLGDCFFTAMRKSKEASMEHTIHHSSAIAITKVIELLRGRL